MIYEIRTYDIKTGMVPEVEKRFAEAYQHRKKYSELAGFWHTEIGPLNQIVQLWPYKDIEERARIRDAARQDPHWPPKIYEFVTNMHSDITALAPCSPQPVTGNIGPYFEMRTYTVPPGGLDVAIENWEQALPNRLQHSSLLGVWYTQIGALNRWIHIWPYRSLEERMTIRGDMQTQGLWPPSAIARREGRPAAEYITQESKLLLAAKFSPVQ